MKINSTFAIIIIAGAFLAGVWFGKYSVETNQKVMNDYQQCLESEKIVTCRAMHFNY